MRIRRWLPFVLLLVVIALAPAAAAISIGPGVACITHVGTEYRFESVQHFTVINVGYDELRLDSLHLQFHPHNGTFKANITSTDPGAQKGDKLIVWNGTMSPGTTVWFNLSGLTPTAIYTLLVDNAPQGDHTVDATGSLSATWTDWAASKHAFAFVTAFAGVSGTDWLMLMLIFLLIFLVTLGLLDAVGLGGIWLMFAGFVAMFLAVEAYTVTASIAISIMCAGIGALLLVAGAWKGIAWGSG